MSPTKKDLDTLLFTRSLRKATKGISLDELRTINSNFKCAVEFLAFRAEVGSFNSSTASNAEDKVTREIDMSTLTKDVGKHQQCRIVLSKLDELGLSLNELTFYQSHGSLANYDSSINYMAPKVVVQRKKVDRVLPVIYSCIDDNGVLIEWSGRGKMPLFMKEKIEQYGYQKQDFHVDNGVVDFTAASI